MLFLKLILVGISLSMDAFSLAFSLNIYYRNISKRKYIISVGIFHFFMPILGFIAKKLFNNFLLFNENILFKGIIIFIIISIIIDHKQDLEKLINPILFGLTVSIDSLLIGLTINYRHLIISCTTFSLISSFTSYIAFKFSSYINKYLNRYSKIIAILILLILVIIK